MRLTAVAALCMLFPAAVWGADAPGRDVYEKVCAACHAQGVLNAPKLGDKKAWAPLIKEGYAMLTRTAIKGIRQMPARGGNPKLTDDEVAAAVAYMANQAGAKWDGTKSPVAAKKK